MVVRVAVAADGVVRVATNGVGAVLEREPELTERTHGRREEEVPLGDDGEPELVAGARNAADAGDDDAVDVDATWGPAVVVEVGPVQAESDREIVVDRR